MSGGLELPVGAALRSNPMQFKNLADDFEERWGGATSAASKLRETGLSYARDHSGPDIDVISSGLAQIADAYDDRVSGYSALADAFETTYKALIRLEERSDALDRDRSNLRSSETYGELSADLLNASNGLEVEFDAIREAERTVLVALGNVIGSVTFGEDISYDSAAWNDVIGRAIQNTDDPDLQLELRTSWVAIADHADNGTIDDDGISDELSEKVVEARLNGQTSEEAGLPAVLFPPDYDKDIERLREAEHDDHGNVPWLGNPSDEERAEASKIREKLGLDEDRDVRKIQIISETADLHGAEEWKGQELGEVYEENLIGRLDRPSATGLSDEAIELLGEEISDSPKVSVSFFNEIGVDNTAEIPTALEGKSALIAPFSESLAEASHRRGNPRLSFSGTELIEAVKPHEIAWPPEILFAEGDFESEFLGEATQASIERRSGDELPVWRRHFEGDPTNIMLARSAQDPEAAQKAVQGLEDKGLTHILIDPEVGYDSAVDGSEPIADFLGAAGADKDTAKILLGGATKVEEFSDPGVAAGFDRVMGQHATVMYDETYLESHGIDPQKSGTLSQEEWLELGFTQRDWEKLQEKALEHGQGMALVSGNDELIRQAIAYDLQPGNSGSGEGEINNDYARFGLTGGVLERNYVEGVIDFEARIDADSEEYNRWLSTGRSTGLFLTGFVPGGRPVADGVIGVVDIVASHFAVEGELGFTKDADREKKKLGELLDEYLETSAKTRYGVIAQIEAIRAAELRAEEAKSNGLTVDPVVDENGNSVRLVETDAGTKVEVRNEYTGDWEIASPNWSPKDEYPDNGIGIGDSKVTVEGKVGDPHENASKAADPTPGFGDEEHIDYVHEADVWAPILRERIELETPPVYTMPGMVEIVDGPDDVALSGSSMEVEE